MAPRGTGAIALLPANAHGSWYFMSLQSGDRIIRSSWTSSPIDDDVIQRVHDLALSRDSSQIENEPTFEWAPGVPIAASPALLEGAHNDDPIQTHNNSNNDEEEQNINNEEEMHANDATNEEEEHENNENEMHANDETDENEDANVTQNDDDNQEMNEEMKECNIDDEITINDDDEEKKNTNGENMNLNAGLTNDLVELDPNDVMEEIDDNEMIEAFGFDSSDFNNEMNTNQMEDVDDVRNEYDRLVSIDDNCEDERSENAVTSNVIDDSDQRSETLVNEEGEGDKTHRYPLRKRNRENESENKDRVRYNLRRKIKDIRNRSFDKNHYSYLNVRMNTRHGKIRTKDDFIQGIKHALFQMSNNEPFNYSALQRNVKNVDRKLYSLI